MNSVFQKVHSVSSKGRPKEPNTRGKYVFLKLSLRVTQNLKFGVG